MRTRVHVAKPGATKSETDASSLAWRAPSRASTALGRTHSSPGGYTTPSAEAYAAFEARWGGRLDRASILGGAEGPAPSSALSPSSPDHPLERAADEVSRALVEDYRGAAEHARSAPAHFAHALGLGPHTARLHTGAEANALAAHHGARAVTMGRDVHFASATYDTHSTAGLALLAHEMVHVAQHARAPTRTQGIAWRTPDPSAAEDRLSVSIYGLRVTFGRGLELRATASREASIARMLAALTGLRDTNALTRDLMERIEIDTTAERRHRGRGRRRLDPDATHGYVHVYGDIASDIVEWLRERRLPVRLSPEQRATLRLAKYAVIAYRMSALGDVPEGVANEDKEAFFSAVARQGARLARFATAHAQWEKSRSEADRQAMMGALAELRQGFDAGHALLRAIAADGDLATHAIARRLRDAWDMQLRLIAFAETTGTLASEARVEGAPGHAARVRLLDAFARSALYPLVESDMSRDHEILDAPPPTFARPALPAVLSVSPDIEAPDFIALEDVPYTFTMSLDHRGDFIQAYNENPRYRYVFEIARVREEAPSEASSTLVERPMTLSRVDASATPSSPTGTPAPTPGPEPARSDVNDLRFSREHLRREREGALARRESLAEEETLRTLESHFGRGASAYASAGAANALRDLGSTIGSVFTMSSSDGDPRAVVALGPGAYVLRATAHMTGTENLRLPSVAYHPIFVRHGARVAEQELDAQVAERNQAASAITQLRGRLADATPETRLRIEAAIRDLEMVSATDLLGPLRLQERSLRETLESLPPYHPDTRAIRAQLEDVRAILQTRADRIADRPAGASAPFRIWASFIGDDGSRVRLMLEVFEQSGKYQVSDSTAPSSGMSAWHTGRRDTAILAAVDELLSGRSGYGPGQLVLELDGQRHRRRIRRSIGSILDEAADNTMTLAAPIAALLAPVTGGGSLVVMGLIGGARAGERLWGRYQDHTLRFDDPETVMDLVDVVGALVGVGELAALRATTRVARSGRLLTPAGRRIVRIGDAIAVVGRAEDALGTLVLAHDVVLELERIAALPPEQRGNAVGLLFAQHLPAASTRAMSAYLTHHTAARRRATDAAMTNAWHDVERVYAALRDGDPDAAAAALEQAERRLPRALRGGTDAALARDAIQAARDGGRASPETVVRPRVLGRLEFDVAAHGRDADAAVIIRDGRAEIVYREGARTDVVREEMVHLQQLYDDPAMRPRMQRLSEEALAGWSEMPPAERLARHIDVLEVEADAQRRIIDQLGERAARGDLDANAHIARANDTLLALVAERDRAYAARGGDADALASIDLRHPPRIFGRTGRQRSQSDIRDARALIGARLDDDSRARLERLGYQVREHQQGPDVGRVRDIARDSAHDGLPALTLDADGNIAASTRPSFSDRLAAAPAQWRATAQRDTPFLQALARRVADGRWTEATAGLLVVWNREITDLARRAGPGELDALLDVIPANGIAASTHYEAFPRALRRRIVDHLYTVEDPHARRQQLDEVLAIQHDHRTKGEIFTDYRARLMRGLGAGDGGPAFDVASASPPRLTGADLMKPRRGDGDVRVTRTIEELPDLEPGRYLVEDKAGSQAFDPDQAADYARRFTAGQGFRLTQAPGPATFDGLLYVFSTEEDADRAYQQMRRHPLIRHTLDAPHGIQVYFLTNDGSLQRMTNDDV